MAQGWIKLHRQLKECWLWDEKPFDRTHAWLDLLLRANHQDKKVPLGNELILVERGSFITSELKLSDAWGWSKTKVRAFLKLLQDDEMIIIKTDKKKTTINIVNYSVYQDSENQEKTVEEPQKNQLETTKEPQKYTNKNDKNDKNIFSSDSSEYRLAAFLKNWILKNNPSARVPEDLQKWSKTFDLMIRVDKRTVEEIRNHIEFSQKDTFWKGNILSADTLRKQYDQLTMKLQTAVKDKPVETRPNAGAYKVVDY